jgi:PAS domain S-box-containing protein
MDGSAERRSCQRYDRLLDSVPALIAYTDAQYRIVLVNRAYADSFGRRAEELIGRPVREHVGAESFERNRPYFDAALAGTAQQFENTVVDPSGALRHTQVSFTPDIVGGVVDGVVVMITDITALVEARQVFNDAQRLAAIGSWVLDPATGMLIFSDELYRIIGIDRPGDGPRLDQIQSMIHPDDQERADRVRREAIRDGEGYEIDYRLRRPDGREVHVHGIGHVERGPDGHPVRVWGTLQDVTAARAAAAQLLRVNAELAGVNRLQADMITVLGHDVQQPITVVMSYLELLLAGWDEEDDEAKKHLLGRVAKAATRINALVDDVLALSVVDSGALTCLPRFVDVVALLAEVEAEVDTPFEVRAEPTEVLADPRHLRRALTNLITNAGKYGAAPIEVTVRGQDETVEIEVRDHGEGVPPEFVPLLFERSSRAQTGVATQRPGTGFGLYIVKQFIEANHGQVGYHPHVPNGACFTVTLPAAPRRPGAGPARRNERARRALR